MAKKKVRDFDKVRLKLGKKLKRQNETVVDLSKKKIFLPRDKNTSRHSTEKKANMTILDGHIKMLQSSNAPHALNAVTIVQSILAPFASQMRCITTRDIRNQEKNSPLDMLLKKLFSCSVSTEDFNFQVGDLLNSLNHISQNSQNAKLPMEISNLCSTLCRLFSCHPRLHTVLTCIDRVAISLLHRPESSWRMAGCRILSSVSECRLNVMRCLHALSSPLQPFAFPDELHALTNSSYQIYRANIYPRLLIRHYKSLTESTTVEANRSRMDFLLATMHFLRDFQYSMYITPLDFQNSPKLLKLHPFLIPYTLCEKNEDTQDLSDYAGNDLHSAWMLIDPELSEDNKPFISARSFNMDNNADSSFYHRQLAVFLAKEGLRYLDELVHSPKQQAVNGLIYVARSLRVLAEVKGSSFFLRSKSFVKSSNLQSPDVSGQVLRFCRRLRELLPLDMPESALLSSSLSTKSLVRVSSTLAQPPVASVFLSRREESNARKRATKVSRRADCKMDSASPPLDDASLQDKNSTANKLEKHEVMTHLLKQASIELWWSLAVLVSTIPDNSGSQFRDHPLRPDRSMLAELARFLLDKTPSDEGSSSCQTIQTISEDIPHVVRPLSAINSLHPTLSWRWLGVFDRCILHCQRTKTQPSSVLAGFVAPMLLCLWRTLHRWHLHCLGGINTARTPRSIVRIAGILIAFLSDELHEQSWTGMSSRYAKTRRTLSSIECSVDSMDYDSSWIMTTASSMSIKQFCASEKDLFSFLCKDLRETILLFASRGSNVELDDLLQEVAVSEAIIEDPSSSCWLWAAICLKRLVDRKFSPAVATIAGESNASVWLARVLQLVSPLSNTTFLKPACLLDPLVYLPSPDSGCYVSSKAWHSGPIASLLA